MKLLSLSSHNNIGLALSGGGARGFAHVGVLLAFEKFDIKPKIISGVSAGSIVAALYGAGLKPLDILKCLTDSKFGDFTEWTLPKASIFRLTRFAKHLESWLPIKNLEETEIRVVICATDFDNGKSVGWRKGEIVPRVVASCSIPIIFSPVKINGVNYVDGGVLRNLPAWAIRNNCSVLVGSNVSPLDRSYKYRKSIVGIAMRTFNLMSTANSLQDIQMCDVLIQTEQLSKYSTFDINSMKKITTHGYDCACKALEKFLL